MCDPSANADQDLAARFEAIGRELTEKEVRRWQVHDKGGLFNASSLLADPAFTARGTLLRMAR